MEIITSVASWFPDWLDSLPADFDVACISVMRGKIEISGVKVGYLAITISFLR